MQRRGRSGHAMFRMVVQDSQRTPTSGKVVAYIGSFDPHTKTLQLDKEKIGFYIDHGAQPSDRVLKLLKQEKMKLPAWAIAANQKHGRVRNPSKRRSTAPAKEKAAIVQEAETNTGQDSAVSAASDTTEPTADKA